MEDLLLITNAAAGTNEQESVDRATGVLSRVTSVEVAETSTPEELDDVLADLQGRGVVVAGGDGSLHAVVNALWHRELLGSTRLGLVPLGTGNDFARGVGIPLDPAAAAAVVTAGRTRRIDLIVDDESTVVVNNVHIGVGAQASHNAHRIKKVLGRAGYALGALKAAVKPPFLRLRIEVDDHVVADFAHPILMVAIGNGSRVGGGAAITPEADPKDGRLDVMVSFSTSAWDKLGYAVRFRLGNHHERKDVLYLRAQRVSVSGQDFYCSADGELYGPERNRTWHIEPGAFSMPLP